MSANQSVLPLPPVVVDMKMSPARPEPAEDQPDAMVAMVERMAVDPRVDVDKLERLMAMREREIARNAKAAFDLAFAEMQKELPVIVARKKGDKWKYAPLEDIIDVVRPILNKHGFGLSHRTEWPDGPRVRIVGVLAHTEGHEKTSTFESAADKSGSKNDVQALGSTVAYGRRLTTKDLLNIATRDEDDDAKLTARKAAEAPDDEAYDKWVIDLQLVAEREGWASLQATWGESPKPYKKRLTETDLPEWNRIKDVGEQTTKAYMKAGAK